MSRDDIHNLESGVYIHGIRSLNGIGPQSSTVFDGDLNIGVKGENIDAIALLDKNSTVIINGKTTLTVDNPDDSDAIVVSKGNLILNGESFINGDVIVVDEGIVKINR